MDSLYIPQVQTPSGTDPSGTDPFMPSLLYVRFSLQMQSPDACQLLDMAQMLLDRYPSRAASHPHPKKFPNPN